jgi:long-chain acyl-CoA synthetase
MFFGVPTTYLILSESAASEEMDGIRYYFSAAANLPLAVEQRWKDKFGAPIFQGYGLTETSPFASYNHLEKHTPGSIGNSHRERRDEGH